jgi:PTH1 family peptidyl-tRNA hydrolase
VVVDDLALPLGRLRLRARGTDGGHNGLKSVEAAIGGLNYARLRLGIGHPSQTRSSDPDAAGSTDYVLSPFVLEELPSVRTVLKAGAEACRLWAAGPIETAMSAVNRDTAEG